MSKKKDTSRLTEFGLVRKIGAIDNPILRHFIKKHGLDDQDSLLLGVILDLTDQMKTPIKTTYRALADTAGLTPMQVYRGIGSLHRHRIIEYKPTGDYVHVSFHEIDESIEEITLAHANARKIKKIEDYLSFVKAQNYVPSAELFDLIYPVVGRLIAAKIAEAFRAMVNYVNDRLESSLSLAMWRYRFKSVRSGVPLAEIIMRESLPCFIDEIFLITKKSSILVGHASRTEEKSVDRDLVAGMLSAINDFLKTSFKNGASGANEIQFGDYRIMIYESAHFYAAVVAYGSPSLDLVGAVNNVMDEIHVKYRAVLKNFDGDMSKVDGIDQPLRHLIAEANRAATPQGGGSLIKVKVAGALVAAACIAGTAWWAYTSIRDWRLAKRINDRIERNMPPFSHDAEVSVSGGTAVIRGFVSSRQAGEALAKEAGTFEGISVVRNRTIAADYRSVETYSKDLDGLRAGLESFRLIAVRQDLEKIIVQFPAGATAMGNPQALQVKRAVEILKHYPLVHVDIVAFNDPDGGYDLNRGLAEKRMKAVRDSLASMGIAPGRLHLLDFDPDILSSDSRFAEYRDRRGIMLFARYAE